jgi:hypothetical protein
MERTRTRTKRRGQEEREPRKVRRDEATRGSGERRVQPQECEGTGETDPSLRTESGNEAAESTRRPSTTAMRSAQPRTPRREAHGTPRTPEESPQEGAAPPRPGLRLQGWERYATTRTWRTAGCAPAPLRQPRRPRGPQRRPDQSRKQPPQTYTTERNEKSEKEFKDKEITTHQTSPVLLGPLASILLI